MSNINEGDITLRPTDAFFGLRQRDKITIVADVAGSLEDTYWEFQETDIDGNKTDYYVWYDAGTGSDPALSGKTGISVTISSGDSAVAVATATLSAIDASAARVSAVRDSDEITLEIGAMGAVTAAADGASATGFTFANVITGEKFEFGATDDIELSPEFSFVDVMASQLGETLLDQIQNGNNISVTIPAKEVTATLFQKTLGATEGDTLTVDADTVTGIGESRRFKNMKQFTKELMLRPANETNLDNAVSIWSAKPDLTNINYSGSDLQVMELEFNAYRDGDRPAEVSLAAFGPQDKGMLK